MRCWVYLFLSLFVVLVASAKTNADVSSNLLSNNFMDDWTGTNDHYHGSSILAGVHDEYREQTITLSDHLTPVEIQGVSSAEFNAEIWFWNSYEQSTSLSLGIVDSNGIEYNNTITVQGDCTSWNGCGYQTSPTNTIVITNPANDMDITARFSFSVPSQPNSHYAADVKDPNLVVNYEPFSIDLSATDDINNWLSAFEEQFREDFEEPDFFITEDFEEPDIIFDDYLFLEEPTVIFAPEPDYLAPTMDFMDEAPIFFSEEEIELPLTTEDVMESMEFMMMPEEMQEEVLELMSEEPAEMPEEIEEMPEEITEEAEDMLLEPEILTEEEFLEESIKEEVPEEIKEDVSMEGETPEEISTDDVQDIKIKKTALAEAIEIDQVQITLMIDSQPIMLDTAFYTPINIYPQQITMVDNRQIYGNISYVVNDPLTTHNNLVNGNREQQYEIRTKLQGMRWIN